MEKYSVEFLGNAKKISVPERSTLFQAAQQLGLYPCPPCVTPEQCPGCWIELVEGMIDCASPLPPPSETTSKNKVLACTAKILGNCKVQMLPSLPISPHFSYVFPSWKEAKGLFGQLKIHPENDIFAGLERQILEEINSPVFPHLDCDYDLLQKAQQLPSAYALYCLLPGRIRLLHLSSQATTFYLFCAVLGQSFSEIALLQPLQGEVLYHRRYSATNDWTLFFQDAYKRYSKEKILGGFVAGVPQELQKFLKLSRPPLSTRPTELQKLGILLHPKAVVYPLDSQGASSYEKATAIFLRQVPHRVVLVDISEGMVMATFPEEIRYSQQGTLWPRSLEKISFKEELDLLLKIYQKEKSPSPRLWRTSISRQNKELEEAEDQGLLELFEKESSLTLSEVKSALEGWNWLWQVALAFTQQLKEPYELWITGASPPLDLKPYQKGNLIEIQAKWIESPALKGMFSCIFQYEALISLETLKLISIPPEKAQIVQL
jgi:DNA-binding Lrp family transcriptional regulator/ferredoxin